MESLDVFFQSGFSVTFFRWFFESALFSIGGSSVSGLLAKFASNQVSQSDTGTRYGDRQETWFVSTSTWREYQ